MLAGSWNDGAPSPVTTFRLGVANGVASLMVVVLLAPLLGAMTDQARRRKPWLALFTRPGRRWRPALLAALARAAGCAALLWFVLASVGFFAANSLYDAMLIDVAEPEELRPGVRLRLRPRLPGRRAAVYRQRASCSRGRRRFGLG